MRKTKVIKTDLRSKYGIDIDAMGMLKMLEPQVSEGLYNEIYEKLIGFDAQMQVEMVDALLDYEATQTARKTGCQSVDHVLAGCYIKMTAEQLLAVLREVIETVREKDEPMQDLVADIKFEIERSLRDSPGELCSVCQNELAKLMGVLDGRKRLKATDPDFDAELTAIADMVRGYAHKNYDDALKDCARTIRRIADKTLKGCSKKSARELERLWNSFVKEAATTLKDNRWNPWPENRNEHYYLPIGYLCAWFERKYWSNNKSNLKN